MNDTTISYSPTLNGIRVGSNKLNMASSFILPSDDRPFILSDACTFGLEINSRNQNNVVNLVSCRFCTTFGRDHNNWHAVKTTFFKRFQTDLYTAHLETYHALQWKEYQNCTLEYQQSYFNTQQIVHVITTYIISSSIVKNIVQKCFPTLPSFTQHGEDYHLPLKNKNFFHLILNAIARGSYGKKNIEPLPITGDSPVHDLKQVEPDIVCHMLQTVVALNLEGISILMKKAWGYTMVLQGCFLGTEQAFLDMRIRVADGSTICTLHVLAIPTFDEKSSDELFTLMSSVMHALDSNWHTKLIGVNIDEDSRYACENIPLVLKKLEEKASVGYYQIVEKKESLELLGLDALFYSTLVRVIVYLRHQEKLVKSMEDDRCPALDDPKRRFALLDITEWFIKHQVVIRNYFTNVGSICVPSDSWWIQLSMVQYVLTQLNSALGGFPNPNVILMTPQGEKLREVRDGVIYACKVRVLSDVQKNSGEIDEDHVVCGNRVVLVKDVYDMIYKRGSLVANLFEECSPDEKHTVAHNIAVYALNMVQLLEATADSMDEWQSTSPKTPGSWKDSTMPVILPHELVELGRVQFKKIVEEQKKRLQLSMSSKEMEDILSEHNKLVKTANRAPHLQTVSNTTFQQGWHTLASIYPRLMYFASGLATVFPSPYHLPIDLSKTNHYNGTSFDITLEGVLHSTQHARLVRQLVPQHF